MHYNVVADIGNSSAKIIFTGYSRVSLTSKTFIKSLLMKPEYVEEKSIEKCVADLQNDLVVEIDSPSILANGFYALGKKAFEISDGVDFSFNISTVKKHEEDLTLITPLSMIAANAIQEYFEKHNDLPTELALEVDYYTALPLEGLTQAVVHILKNRLDNGVHSVSVRVQDEYIPVNITFKQTTVVPEGLPTLFALVLIPDLLAKFTAELSAETLMKSNVMVFDIGEGTTESNMILQGEVNTDQSEGRILGVGHAAIRAADVFMREMKLDFKMNRQEFMSIVRNTTHSQHTHAFNYLQKANVAESGQLLNFLKQRYNVLKGNIDVLIVSGGGASALATQLKPLIEAFVAEKGIKLIWIDEEYAEMMNCLGLGVIASNNQAETQEV